GLWDYDGVLLQVSIKGIVHDLFYSAPHEKRTEIFQHQHITFFRKNDIGRYSGHECDLLSQPVLYCKFVGNLDDSFLFDCVHPLGAGLRREKGIRAQSCADLNDYISSTNRRSQRGLKCKDSLFSFDQSKIIVVVNRLFFHEIPSVISHGSTCDNSSAHSFKSPIFNLNNLAAFTIFTSTDSRTSPEKFMHSFMMLLSASVWPISSNEGRFPNRGFRHISPQSGVGAARQPCRRS